MVFNTGKMVTTKRQLAIRDSMIFLSLTAITTALFVVTLFLFRSFQGHRTELAKRWSDRGLAAFQANKSDPAIMCYRTALSYAPGKRSYELMLAEALAQAGRIEESYNYFIGLREERPGDGFINLQLARLAGKKHDMPGAVNFYRASVYGDWEGDGVERRREVRLELARYLIEQHQPRMAKTELLIAGGNAPDNPALDITLASLLEQTGASLEAQNFYQKALVHQPHSQIALSGAGRIAYRRGDYVAARALLERVVQEQPDNEQSGLLLVHARRILQLMPAETLSARERVDRILLARSIAEKRWETCAKVAPSQNLLQLLAIRWESEDAKASRSILLHDSDKQKATLQLIYDTEIQMSQQCGEPTGDDALLLLLARSSVLEGGSHH